MNVRSEARKRPEEKDEKQYLFYYVYSLFSLSKYTVFVLSLSYAARVIKSIPTINI